MNRVDYDVLWSDEARRIRDVRISLRTRFNWGDG
ncbi:hypothetical protein THIOKS12740014 [Thiocapsa sp. KS1]|nr:hypothetical protein THIOKS12740014 [Thiocapsa sp. KS1]